MGFLSDLFKGNSAGKVFSGTLDEIGKYIPDYYEQDTTKSVIDENGRYDLKRFSKQEFSIIQEVLSSVNRKYPVNFRSLGLANETYSIVYKARYVLFDVIIVQYGKSESPIDQLAVALAYESKSAFFRKDAISYFESAIHYIEKSTLNRFSSYQPMSLYIKFAELYEKEHNYKKAITYVKKARASKGSNKELCTEWIEKLERKLENPPRTRRSKKPDYYDDFERDVRRAAIAFITGDFTGIELNARPNKSGR